MSYHAYAARIAAQARAAQAREISAASGRKERQAAKRRELQPQYDAIGREISGACADGSYASRISEFDDAIAELDAISRDA